jgi:hypothetical protein
MRIYPANSLHEEVKRRFKLPGYLKLILGKRSTLVMQFVAILLAAALIPHFASAKRIAPASVEPVVYEGIRYVAPNDDGRRGYIEAWDVKTNKKLWELTVFTNRIDPKLEADVQWVFINKLTIRDGMLMVTSERGATYQVDLRTKAITQWGPASSPAGGANEQPHDIPEVIKRAITTSSLARNYDLSFRINPFYLRGDFNGDRKIDVAALVKQRSTGKLGMRSFMARRKRQQFLARELPSVMVVMTSSGWIRGRFIPKTVWRSKAVKKASHICAETRFS